MPSWLGAKMSSYQTNYVCGGRVGKGQSWLGAELVRGQDVQLSNKLWHTDSIVIPKI